MQRFTPNSYMANFLSLDRAARFYADVMGLFMRYEEGLSLEYYPVPYERIVSDLEGQAKNLIQFMGLTWNDSVLDYRRHALNQEIINTPSYHQVVRPLYSEAIERWRRYEAYLVPSKEKLTPFCEKFGYTV